MPCRTMSYNKAADWPSIKTWLSARMTPDPEIEARVREIIADVRTGGDDALIKYTRRFDCPEFDPGKLRVAPQDIETALQTVPGDDLAILKEAAENIRTYHQAQVERSWMTTAKDGTVLGQIVRPVDAVGLYVPGGRGGETPLISSLLMNAVPAQVAGVTRIAVVSPPRNEGTLNPLILATAGMLGINEVYAAGSAWAVAALACGTRTIAPVDVIAGPGNIYVTTAKRLLIGEVGIDIIAGPSEIAILADADADPAWLAADMLSQAEHDAMAAAVLITPDKDLPGKVKNELAGQMHRLPKKDTAEAALADWGAVITVPDMDTGVDLVNRIAPEHLELSVSAPWPLLGKIKHAGAIFMGHFCPEPVGDYFAGPNHVLPTFGTARFASALSVDNFCKKSSLVAASREFVRKHGAKIARMARMEELEAHAKSIEARLKNRKK